MPAETVVTMSDSKVTAVFQCTSKTTNKDYPGQVYLSFVPPYCVDGGEALPKDERFKRVNEGWSTATPSGALSMSITNPAAHEAFEQGEIYLLSFEKFPR